THLIGNDAFQECDTVGITRPCTKYNYLVKTIADLPRALHEAFHIAASGRPGPVVVDIPKDIQFAKGAYSRPKEFPHRGYRPKLKGDLDKIKEAVDLMAAAKRPLFYTGGGVVNSGRAASDLLRELVKLTGFPITSTLMGLGAFPAADRQWLGMLGMHGTWEANWSMHDCDLMIAVGARFDDRITGRLDAFSPGSRRSTSTLTRPRSTRTSRPIWRSSVTARMCSRTWCACGARAPPFRTRRRCRRGGSRSGNGGQKNRSPSAIPMRSSSRNTRSSGSTSRPRTAILTSPPKSVSTRCGRRSSIRSRSRTA